MRIIINHFSVFFSEKNYVTYEPILVIIEMSDL